MALSTFRRNTKSETKKQGGKGLRGNWREQFRLPKVAPTPFVLIKGEYTDPDPDPEVIEVGPQGQAMPVIVAYWKWLKHRLKTMTQTGKQRFIDEPCSRGWDKHAPQPCAGCAAQDAGDKRITLSETYSIGLAHLAVYHRHPLVDPKKGPIMKKDNSGPVLVDSECLDKQCNFCRVAAGQTPVLQPNEFWPQYDPKSIIPVFGSRRYMELGKGHLGDLGEWDKQIGSRCGGVAYVRNPDGSYVLNQQGQAIPKGRCNAFLDVDGYVCSLCGNMLINAEQDPRPLEQLEQLAMAKYPCHYCQRQVFLKEVNSCSSCGQAMTAGLFDGVLWGQRVGEDTQSHLVLVQFDTIDDYEANLHPSYRQLLQGKPLKERLQELCQPYSFSELYKPKSLEDQAKRLELSGQMQYGAYGAPAQQMQPQQFVPGYAQPTPYQGGQPYPQPTVPGYTPYGNQQGTPQPPPFQPPVKPNFGN